MLRLSVAPLSWGRSSFIPTGMPAQITRLFISIVFIFYPGLRLVCRSGWLLLAWQITSCYQNPRSPPRNGAKELFFLSLLWYSLLSTSPDGQLDEERLCSLKPLFGQTMHYSDRVITPCILTCHKINSCVTELNTKNGHCFPGFWPC